MSNRNHHITSEEIQLLHDLQNPPVGDINFNVTLAELQNTINSLDKFLANNIFIGVTGGSISTSISINGFHGPGALIIEGSIAPNDLLSTHNIGGSVNITNCESRIDFAGFRLFGASGNSIDRHGPPYKLLIDNSQMVNYNRNIMHCDLPAALAANLSAFVVRRSNVNISFCSISGYMNIGNIRAWSKVFMGGDVTGSNNLAGIITETGSILFYNSRIDDPNETPIITSNGISVVDGVILPQVVPGAVFPDNLVARSVLGRGETPGIPEAITANDNHHILRRRNNTISFGLIRGDSIEEGSINSDRLNRDIITGGGGIDGTLTWDDTSESALQNNPSGQEGMICIRASLTYEIQARLTDSESGSWIPEVPNGMVVHQNNCTYTRVDRLCYLRIHFNLALDVGSRYAAIIIRGIPFQGSVGTGAGASTGVTQFGTVLGNNGRPNHMAVNHGFGPCAIHLASGSDLRLKRLI